MPATGLRIPRRSAFPPLQAGIPCSEECKCTNCTNHGSGKDCNHGGPFSLPKNSKAVKSRRSIAVRPKSDPPLLRITPLGAAPARRAWLRVRCTRLSRPPRILLGLPARPSPAYSDLGCPLPPTPVRPRSL